MNQAVLEKARSLGEALSGFLTGVRLVVAIVLAGVLVATLLVALRSAPPKVAPQKVAALVEVVTTEPRNESVLLTGYGTVEAKRELEVRPQVSGHVVKLHKQLQVGGRAQTGDLLFQIDPRDYQIAVDAQQAALLRAEFELKLEEGNQIVAKREWGLLEKDMEVSAVGRELALREPHMKEKKAALASAQSQLEKAKLDLERTAVRAPFPVVVLDESVEVGKYVSPANMVARLAATDEFYVQVKLARALLQWLPFEDPKALEKVSVQVIQQLDSGVESVREAKLVRLLGDVDTTGRMARVLVSVKDPLTVQGGEQPLLLGSYVKVLIAGREVEDVISLPRQALREGSVVWVIDQESKLDIRPVESVFTQDSQVFVRGKLSSGEQVVISPLQSALAGTLLEVSAQEQ